MVVGTSVSPPPPHGEYGMDNISITLLPIGNARWACYWVLNQGNYQLLGTGRTRADALQDAKRAVVAVLCALTDEEE